MAVHTSTKTVTFKKSFRLHGLKRELSAGDYTVERHEEPIVGLSFPVYRRVLPQMHLCTVPDHPGWSQILDIDPQDLNGALACEGVQRSAAAERKIGHG